MREIITLNVGQAGVQLAQTCWQLCCLENSISTEGKLQTYPQQPKNDKFTSFFSQNEEEKYIPRTVFIDLEPTAINSYKKNGMFRNIYGENHYVSGKEDSGNNYASGYHNNGSKIIDLCLDKIRKQAEKCTNLEGFLINHSISGGTGSGFGSLLLQKLSKEYQKKSKVSFTIFPSYEHSKIIVQPYNQILALKSIRQHCNMSFVLDNTAVYNICQRMFDMDLPGYLNLNRVISRVISHITTPFRYQNACYDSLSDLESKLVPYPSFKFIQSSHGPLHSVQKSCGYYQIQDTIRLCFQNSFMMAKCYNTKYMACRLIYRGDGSPKYIKAGIQTAQKQKSFRFVDWCTPSVGLGITQERSRQFANDDISLTVRSCGMVANCTGIIQVPQRSRFKFNQLWKSRAFVHWYIMQGMQQEQFTAAEQSLEQLESQYQQAQQDAEEEEEENKPA